jgi:alpha-beta hydrolase superfamily lysophospholipase
VTARATALMIFALAAGAGCMPPSWAANAILHPQRRPMTRVPDRPFDTVEFEGAGVKLKGWWFHAPEKRGTLVYLHGLSDNRGTSVGIADHFLSRGFDVVAYDSRAHGESGGDVCSYGVFEKQDLARVLDRIDTKPIILMGTSLGGGIALQAAGVAGIDRRVAAVVAISPFADLRTGATERAPWFASKGNIADAFALVEAEGKFRVDDASAVAAAGHVTAPALLVHGARDDETPPAHSQRIYATLHEPKRLILVPNATHNHVVDAQVWREIDAWVDTAVAAAGTSAAAPRP